MKQEGYGTKKKIRKARVHADVIGATLALLLIIAGCTRSASTETNIRRSNLTNVRAPQPHQQKPHVPEPLEGLRRVKYVSDSIMEKENGFIRLLSGSTWQLLTPSLALVTNDILIILTVDDSGIAFLDKEEIPSSIEPVPTTLRRVSLVRWYNPCEMARFYSLATDRFGRYRITTNLTPAGGCLLIRC